MPFVQIIVWSEGSEVSLLSSIDFFFSLQNTSKGPVHLYLCMDGTSSDVWNAGLARRCAVQSHTCVESGCRSLQITLYTPTRHFQFRLGKRQNPDSTYGKTVRKLPSVLIIDFSIKSEQNVSEVKK